MSDLINVPAPDFSLPTLGGGRFTLSEMRGYIVVINFWSAECPWSRRADVVLVYRNFAWRKHGVRIVGVASSANEPESEVRYEAEVRRVNYPLVLDSRQAVARLYGVSTTPHFFVLDAQGVIRYNGALDDANSQQRLPKTIYLDSAVTALLNRRAPEVELVPPYGSDLALTQPEEK